MPACDEVWGRFCSDAGPGVRKRSWVVKLGALGLEFGKALGRNLIRLIEGSEAWKARRLEGWQGQPEQ